MDVMKEIQETLKDTKEAMEAVDAVIGKTASIEQLKLVAEHIGFDDPGDIDEHDIIENMFLSIEAVIVRRLCGGLDYTESYRLTLGIGGPNVFVDLRPNGYATVVVAWGSEKAEEEAYLPHLAEFLEQIEEGCQ